MCYGVKRKKVRPTKLGHGGRALWSLNGVNRNKNTSVNIATWPSCISEYMELTLRDMCASELCYTSVQCVTSRCVLFQMMYIILIPVSFFMS